MPSTVRGRKAEPTLKADAGVPAARRLKRGSADPKRQGCARAVQTAVTFVVGSVLAVVCLTAVVALGLSAASGIPDYLLRGLPGVEGAVEKQVFRTATIYDREGRLLYEFWDPQGGKRTTVPLREIPPYLIDATLATEDPRFYDNPGFDAPAILRAFWQNLLGQAIFSGGSTITQQLVRNSLMDPAERYERSYVRKAKEVVLAYQLSQRYSKDEILERYLNEIYYGNLAYGVEAAAQTYFGKHVGELTVAEAALLAGLPQAPAANDPLANPRRAKERQREVLGLMVRHGYLPASAAAVAEREELRFHTPTMPIRAPHFTMYVRALLEARYSREQLYCSGLQVHTTLDLDLQELAERVTREHVARLRSQNARNAALVAVDLRTGEILAMVGSADYWDEQIGGQVNMVLAERQAGSTLKPFTYLAAFARGKASPATVILDEPTTFSGGQGAPAYRPRNADGKYRGPVTVRRALANSLNVPAVKMLSQLGVPALLDTLHELGITSLNAPPEHYGLALALGAGEVRLLDLTYAYAVLANGGLQVGEPVPGAERLPGRRELRPVAIARVVDASGRVLEEYHPSGKRVVSQQATWLVTDILADDAARAETHGPDSPLRLSRPAAVQTGTGEGLADSWAVGYSPDLAVGAWIGNANNEPMRGVTGISVAGALWHDFMEEALRGFPTQPFDRPSGLVRGTVDAQTGLRPGPGASTVTDWFVEGNVPRLWAVPTPTPTPLPTATPTPSPSPTPTVTPSASPTAPDRPGGTVRVPSLVALPEAEARRLVELAGLANTYANYQTVEDVVDWEFFNSIPVGHVLSQMPASGTVVRQGTTVYLAVRKR